MQVLFLVRPAFVCIDAPGDIAETVNRAVVVPVIDHLVGIDEGVAGKFHLDRATINLHGSVVVLSCRSINPVRIGTVQQYIGKALPLVPGGIRAAVQPRIEAVTQFFHQYRLD